MHARGWLEGQQRVAYARRRPLPGLSRVQEALAAVTEVGVRSRSKWWFCACATLCSLWSAGAHAQSRTPPGTPPPAYGELIGQALVEYDARNFAEARALFLKAHALYPNARTLRGIGVTEYELRNYADAVARLEEALASNVKPLTGPMRAQAEESLARARTFVARVRLQTRPTVVRVTVDGVPIELGADQALTLTVGEHVLRVEAPGYQAQRRELSIKGGEQRRLMVELQPRETVPGPTLATAAPLAAATKEDSSAWSSPWLWTSLGVVVVGGVVAGVLVAANAHDDASEPIRGDIGGLVQTLRVR